MIKKIKLIVLLFFVALTAFANFSNEQILLKCKEGSLSLDFENCWKACKIPIPPSQYANATVKKLMSLDDKDKFDDCLDAKKCRDLDGDARRITCTRTYFDVARTCDNAKTESQKKAAACAIVEKYKNSISLFMERDTHNCSNGFSSASRTIETINEMSTAFPKTSDFKNNFTMASQENLSASCSNLTKYQSLCKYATGELKSVEINKIDEFKLPSVNIPNRVFSFYYCYIGSGDSAFSPPDEAIDILRGSKEIKSFITDLRKNSSDKYLIEKCSQIKNILQTCNSVEVNYSSPSGGNSGTSARPVGTSK